MKRLSLALLLAGCGSSRVEDRVCAAVEAAVTGPNAAVDVREDFTVVSVTHPDGTGDRIYAESVAYTGCDGVLTNADGAHATGHSVAHVAGRGEGDSGSVYVEITHPCDLVRYDQGYTATCGWVTPKD